MLSCGFCEISENTFSYRTHLVAAFDHLKCIAALALTIQQHFTLKIPSLPLLDFLEA